VEIVDDHQERSVQDEQIGSLSASCPSGRNPSEDFMKPLFLTVNSLAHELRVPATRIGEIVHERRRITAETALRIARYFNTNAEFWLNLQNFSEDLADGQTYGPLRVVNPLNLSGSE
jgi:addiction module HigA family antidote